MLSTVLGIGGVVVVSAAILTIVWKGVTDKEASAPPAQAPAYDPIVYGDSHEITSRMAAALDAPDINPVTGQPMVNEAVDITGHAVSVNSTTSGLS